jgi:hypothetical protein
METGGSRFGSQFRRFIVDVSIGAATLAVAFATISMAANFLYLLLIPCALALICFGLVLEPKATPGADIDTQPLRYSTRLATLDETQPYVIG